MERIKYFPIPFFAVIMGMSGLAILFQKISHTFGFTIAIGNSLAYLSLALFVLILFFYSLKAINFFEEVQKEFLHPIRVNFFATISISLLLLSIAFLKISPMFSETLWYVGVVLHTYMTFHVVSFWIRHNFEITHSNPAWFIPIVGNVLVPVSGIEFASKEVVSYFFSVGMFFWIVLGAILFYRIIFHHQLAQKFIPTLFILIAPPAVGFIAYMKIFGTLDVISMSLINLTIFFTALLFFMGKSFLKLKFFISWWAFTFPLDAAAIAMLSAYSYTNNPLYLYFGGVVAIIATSVVIFVSIATILNIAKKEICVDE